MPKEVGWWRIYRNRNALFVFHYLSSRPCVDCGETDPVVLDFDHVRGVKRKNISRMLSSTHSLAAISAEIEKCDVRCANCHRRVTAKRGGMREYLAPGARTVLTVTHSKAIRHGTVVGYRRGCRCNECRAAQTARERIRRAKRRDEAQLLGTLFTAG